MSDLLRKLKERQNELKRTPPPPGPFKIEYADKKHVSAVMCVVCCGLPQKESVTFDCMHVYCFDCIIKTVNVNDLVTDCFDCPHCSRSSQMKEIDSRIVIPQVVYPKGRHLLCPTGQCDKILEDYEEMLDHYRNKCEHRYVSCVTCNKWVRSNLMSQHEDNECEEFVLCGQLIFDKGDECKFGCNAKILRKNMKYHYQNDCPERYIKCSRIKCNVRFKPLDLQKHEVDYGGVHLGLCDKEIEELKEKIRVNAKVMAENQKMVDDLKLQLQKEIKEKEEALASAATAVNAEKQLRAKLSVKLSNKLGANVSGVPLVDPHPNPNSDAKHLTAIKAMAKPIAASAKIVISAAVPDSVPSAPLPVHVHGSAAVAGCVTGSVAGSVAGITETVVPTVLPTLATLASSTSVLASVNAVVAPLATKNALVTGDAPNTATTATIAKLAVVGTRKLRRTSVPVSDVKSAVVVLENAATAMTVSATPAPVPAPAPNVAAVFAPVITAALNGNLVSASEVPLVPVVSSGAKPESESKGESTVEMAKQTEKTEQREQKEEQVSSVAVVTKMSKKRKSVMGQKKVFFGDYQSDSSSESASEGDSDVEDKEKENGRMAAVAGVTYASPKKKAKIDEENNAQSQSKKLDGNTSLDAPIVTALTAVMETSDTESAPNGLFGDASQLFRNIDTDPERLEVGSTHELVDLTNDDSETKFAPNTAVTGVDAATDKVCEKKEKKETKETENKENKEEENLFIFKHVGDAHFAYLLNENGVKKSTKLPYKEGACIIDTPRGVVVAGGISNTKKIENKRPGPQTTVNGIYLYTKDKNEVRGVPLKPLNQDRCFASITYIDSSPLIDSRPVVEIAPSAAASTITTAAKNDILCVVGGWSKNQYYLDSFDIYHFDRNEWTQEEPIPEAVYGHQAIYHNGSLYVASKIGGKLWSYNFQSKKWTTHSDFLLREGKAHLGKTKTLKQMREQATAAMNFSLTGQGENLYIVGSNITPQKYSIIENAWKVWELEMPISIKWDNTQEAYGAFALAQSDSGFKIAICDTENNEVTIYVRPTIEEEALTYKKRWTTNVISLNLSTE